MIKRNAAPVLLAGLLSLWAIPADAQGVCGYPALCAEYAAAPVIFVGRVIEHIRGAGTLTAKLIVWEVLRGAAPATVEFPIERECDATFELNQDYLVYATQREGVLMTSGCSRTRRVADASEDLDYIRSMGHGPPRTSLYGLVKLTNNGTHDVRAPASFRLILAGAKESRDIFVGDTTGPFEILDIPPGDYSVRVQGPVIRASILVKTPDVIRVHAGACQDLGVYELRLR